MANKKWNFKKVKHNAAVGPALSRKPEAGTIRDTGYTLLNVNGTEVWDEVCLAAGVDFERAAARFEADEPGQLVAVYPIISGTEENEGVGPVRRFKKRTASMHLGGVFKDYKKLRPVGTIEAIVSHQVDDDGKPFMLIDLGLAVSKRAEAEKQAAAAEQK